MCRLVPTLLILLLNLSPQTGNAFHFSGFDEGDKGIGLLLGSPLGLRYESWADWKRTYLIDAGYGAGRTLIASASHLWSVYDVEDYWKDSGLFGSLIVSYGLGAFVGYRLDAGDRTPLQVGVKGLVGFQHMFGRGNFSLRVEVGPALAIVGDRAVTVQGAIGLIYYFGGPIKARSVQKSAADLEFESSDFDNPERFRAQTIPVKTKSTSGSTKTKLKENRSKTKKGKSAEDEFQ